MAGKGNPIPAFDDVREEYAALWRDMTVAKRRAAEIAGIADQVVAAKDRYTAVERSTGVPWFVIAAIHNLETGLSFKKHLHNGDPLTARTKHVPANRPETGEPPFGWETSAVDALEYDGLAHAANWSIEYIAFRLEAYNGWGYRRYHPDVKTPYLWSYANHYTAGKYTADGKWSGTAVSDQCGAMPLLQELAKRDASIAAAIAPVDDRAVLKSALLEPGKTMPLWIAVAKGELGQRDYAGPKYNPRVVEYLRSTGYQGNDDETSWCSAFANWCMQQAGQKGTGDASARSWLQYGQALAEPRPGCIVVLWRENPNSWKGHVGFFDGWDVGNRIRLFGGNQGGGVDWDEVCVATFPKERILGYRWPKGVA